MTSLDKILRTEEIILVDSSVEEVHEFADNIYDTRDYSELDYDELEKVFSCMNCTRELFRQPNVFTIPEVTREKTEFEKIINEKIKHFDKWHFCPNRKKQLKTDHKEKKLKEMQALCYETRMLMRESELRLNKDIYQTLLDSVNLISRELRLKRDTKFRRGERKRDHSYDSDTDERLTTALFYLSIFSDKSPCLLTGDTDFVPLTGVIPRLIGSNELLPFNWGFRERTYQNPYKVYIGGNREYNLAIESQKTEYSPEFLIRRATPERNQEIKNIIDENWKRIVEIASTFNDPSTLIFQ